MLRWDRERKDSPLQVQLLISTSSISWASSSSSPWRRSFSRCRKSAPGVLICLWLILVWLLVRQQVGGCLSTVFWPHRPPPSASQSWIDYSHRYSTLSTIYWATTSIAYTRAQRSAARRACRWASNHAILSLRATPKSWCQRPQRNGWKICHTPQSRSRLFSLEQPWLGLCCCKPWWGDRPTSTPWLRRIGCGCRVWLR